jgi:DNA polymerase zeta
MLKDSQKLYHKYKNIVDILENRQFGIKMLMNVIYGYSAASVSGRMPCVDIADSIVKSGRDIMQNVIRHINNSYYSNCRVIYGDTDSVFILGKGMKA